MTKEEIAKTLKEKRIKAGLEAKEVAEKLIELGAIKSIKSFYNWESGRTQPDADTFMYLCSLYKIDSVMETFGYEQKQIDLTNSHEVATAYENADFDTKNNVRFLLKLPLLKEEIAAELFPFSEPRLTAENEKELEMIRQEMLAEKRGRTSSASISAKDA